MFEENEKPADVSELESSLNDLHQFRALVKSGMYAGQNAMLVQKLDAFLKDLFGQVLKSYQEHPYVKQITEAQAAQQAAQQVQGPTPEDVNA